MEDPTFASIVKDRRLGVRLQTSRSALLLAPSQCHQRRSTLACSGSNASRLRIEYLRDESRGLGMGVVSGWRTLKNLARGDQGQDEVRI